MARAGHLQKFAVLRAQTLSIELRLVTVRDFWRWELSPSPQTRS